MRSKPTCVGYLIPIGRSEFVISSLLKVPPQARGTENGVAVRLDAPAAGQGSVPLAEQGEPHGGGLGTLTPLSLQQSRFTRLIPIGDSALAPQLPSEHPVASGCARPERGGSCLRDGQQALSVRARQWG